MNTKEKSNIVRFITGMKGIFYIISIILFISFILPNLAFAVWYNPISWFSSSNSAVSQPIAQATQVPQTSSYVPRLGVTGLFTLAGSWLKMLLPIVISLAIVLFIWNVFQYAIVDTESEKTMLKTQIVWGIVAIFVMVSIWGLVAILQSTFGTRGVGDPNVIKDVLSPFQ